MARTQKKPIDESPAPRTLDWATAETIKLDFPDTTTSDDGKVRPDMRAFGLRLEKLQFLAEQFVPERDGPPGWGLQLAFAIAQQFVPGFRVEYTSNAYKALVKGTDLEPKKGKGRPKKLYGLALFTDEQLLMLASAHPTRKAASEALAKAENSSLRRTELVKAANLVAKRLATESGRQKREKLAKQNSKK